MRSTQYIFWAHHLTLSEKGEIEELVRLSYQALERHLEERSKTIIKEKGWREAVDVVNRTVPRMRPSEPWVVPQDFPPRPEVRGQHMPSYDEYLRHHPPAEHEEVFPDESRPARAPLPPVYTRGESPVRRHERPMTASPPIHLERQEQDTTKTTRPEVRFTFPREQLVSGSLGTAKEAPSSPAKPVTPATKTDNQLQIVRQKLERKRERKEEAEKAGDISTAADLTYYVIPDLEAELEKLLKQQREEQKKSAAPMSQNEEDKPHQVEVETESEGSDEEGGLDDALYD